jgi:CubicO group peptidase (beta-lactamase class C family)
MTTKYDKKMELRMLPRWLIGLGFTFVLLFSGCAGAPPRPTNIARNDYEPAKQYMSALIGQDMAKHDVKGLSIALIDDQKVVWAEGFGYADVAKNVPATADTMYRIGSISKVLTATEIMRLSEQGKVELDKPVTDYVPEFSIHNRFADSKPITLRALLAHHSGMPSDVLKGMWIDHPVSLAEYVTALREESLASPPQSLYKYSNIDFSLLGRVIENVEHQEFSSAMQQSLLAPLGMVDSSFQLTPEIERRYARAYRNGKEATRLSLRDTPAGGMLSSVKDMSRYLRFIFAEGSTQGTQIIKPETLHEMFKPQFEGLNMDFGHKIGMAWMLSGLSVPGGQPLAWHNGGFPPYQAHISLLPEQKLGVIILTNSDEASQFITKLGTRALELAYETKYGAPPPTRDSAKQTPKSVRMSHDGLARYAGHYVMFNGQIGSITVDGDQLKTSLFDRSFSLQPISTDTFLPKANVALGLISIPIDTLSVRFQTVQGKDVAVLSGLPAPFAFERLPSADIPDAWRKRVGTYQTDTTDEQFDFKQAELATESGFLVFKVVIASKNGVDPEAKVTYALLAISDHEAVVAGIGNGEGGTVRAIDSGNSTKLFYSGFRFARTGNR